MKVHRYVLAPVEDLNPAEPTLLECDVELPSGAEVVDVGFSSKGVTLWAHVDPDADTVEVRSYVVVGNGIDLPEGCSAVTRLGMAKLVGGPTFHVYDVTKVAV
jgi:hypothetical protein